MFLSMMRVWHFLFKLQILFHYVIKRAKFIWLISFVLLNNPGTLSPAIGAERNYRQSFFAEYITNNGIAKTIANIYRLPQVFIPDKNFIFFDFSFSKQPLF